MTNKIIDVIHGDWHLKMMFPKEIENAPVTVLLHGWTGDEKSMWSFAGVIPTNHIVIAPRGLHLSDHPDLGGYSWVGERSGKWSWHKDFLPSADKLHLLLSELSLKYQFSVSKINLMGFSQGSALSYSYLINFPSQVESVAGLAGFMPVNADSFIELVDFSTTRVFIGHGTEDNIVPIDMADEVEEKLRKKGAEVIRCNSKVKHKVGGECLRNLAVFMKSNKY